MGWENDCRVPSFFLQVTVSVAVGSKLVAMTVTGLLSCHTVTVRFPFGTSYCPSILFCRFLQFWTEGFAIESQGTTTVQPSSEEVDTCN